MITDEEVPPQQKPACCLSPNAAFFQLSDHCQSPSVMEPEQKEPPGWLEREADTGLFEKAAAK